MENRERIVILGAGESGTGAAILARQAQVEALNPRFIRLMQQGRPYVRCKLAMSLDGRTAMASGESQWITSPEARRVRWSLDVDPVELF